ncbi:unnamed protein product [Effrenium voratum]|uniref:SSD domain-containing protein n=1 Tax=Effrenium voratum TaxID=2562239 RepID=A0AA36N904_9DINO|nr:unnamed protein product [Effrenium voratum]CAJ1455895.1 unnamed protein product [Effrenium voratum]
MECWLALTGRAEGAASRGLGKLAKASATHPWKCIALSLLCCLLCGLGFLRFEAKSEARDLWVDQVSQVMKDLEWTEEYFTSGGGGEPCRLLITAKSGSILDKDNLMATLQVVQDVKAMVADNGKTWDDVCLRVGSGCFLSGLPRYFGSTVNQSLSQDDILNSINAQTFPDGGDAFPDDSMGGMVRNNGRIVGAKAVRVDWVLRAEQDWEDAWAQALINKFVESSMLKQSYDLVEVFVQVPSSGDDELNRTVRADIPLFALAFVLMSVFCALFLGKPWSSTQSRRLLGCMEFFLVLMGIVAGFGVAMLLGKPFTVLTQILPFILVGIGIDDAFVIAGAFDATDTSLSIPVRVENAMQRVGVSITLTKVTSLVSFLLGATCAFPSVQWFCMFASTSVFFIWLLHCSAFCAMLALDAKRASRDPPGLDPFACISARASCMPGPGDRDATKSPLAQILVSMVRVLVRTPALGLVTVILFLAVAGISIWQASSGLGTDFNIIDLTPDSSYLRDFYVQERLHFGGLSTGGLALPTSYVIMDQNFSSVEVQRMLEEVGAEMLALSNVNSERGLRSWHTIFSHWAWTNRGSLPSLPLDAFEPAPGGLNRSSCAAGLPTGVTACVSHFVTGPHFELALLDFLNDGMSSGFRDDVVWRDQAVKAVRLRATHVDTVNSRQQVAVLEEAEALTAKWQPRAAGSFMSAQAYIFFDQYRIIVEQMTTSIGLCLLAVTVISALVLAHPLSVLIVFVVLALVFTDLMGNIVLWGLDLNSISMINLIMAVGLVVDYSMHMAHNFSLQSSTLSRARRAELAMEEIGPAIFLGVSTTFLAIVPLAFSSSQAFRVFFKMFFGIVVAGGLHGLVFLPVCLAVMGPSVTQAAADPRISNLEDGKEGNEATEPDSSAPKVLESKPQEQ